MGKGKGNVRNSWVAVVKPGRVMFEIAGVSEEVAREALRLAMHKLPVKCKIVDVRKTGGEAVMKATEVRAMSAAGAGEEAGGSEEGPV